MKGLNIKLPTVRRSSVRDLVEEISALGPTLHDTVAVAMEMLPDFKPSDLEKLLGGPLILAPVASGQSNPTWFVTRGTRDDDTIDALAGVCARLAGEILSSDSR